MPSISKIAQQRKDPNRFSIFVDGQYASSLSSHQLAESGLAVGQELTEEELAQLGSDSLYGTALQAAYNLLSYRARSIWEIKDRLGRKGYDSVIITRVIERLTESGLINDDEFAKNWLSAPKSAWRSRRRLAQELKAKRIDKATVEVAIAAIDETHDHQAIRTLIEKRRQKPDQDRQKLLQYLMRQGFSYGAIKSVFDEDFSEIPRP